MAFTRRARAIPDVIRGPYPSTRRRTRFLPHPIILSSRSPDSHANKKLAGSISRTSHLQLVQAQGDLHGLASVRYAWVSVHSVRFVSTGSGEGSSLGQVLHTRFLAFVITHHIRCLYHSHFQPTASITSYCTFIYHSLWTTSASLTLDENIPSKTSPHPQFTTRQPTFQTSFPLEHYEADRTVTTLSILDWRNILVESIKTS